MQTQKAREGAEIIKKKPPLSAATNNKSGKKKKIASDSNSVISSSSSSITPTNTPPKLGERKLPEKKRPATARISELESQVAHLQEHLNKAKDQLRSSESSRRQSQYEAEEAIRRLSLMSQKLEQSQQQLMDISNSEDDRVHQLRKLSQERDRAWQSELEAVQSQKSMDTVALASAMNEIKKLRLQLGRRTPAESETLNLVETLRNELADCRESEAQAMEVLRNTEKQLETVQSQKSMDTVALASAMNEIKNLRLQLGRRAPDESETLNLVETLRNELAECRESEAQALEVLRNTEKQLETIQSQKSMDSAALASARNEIENLRLQLGRRAPDESETLTLVETLRNELAECRESEAQALEVLRNTKMQLEIANVTADTLRSELERLRDQMHSTDEDQEVRDEAKKLRSALVAAETRYQEEYIQSTLQIRSAYEQVELAKQECCQRQTAFEEEMEKMRMDLSEMKGSLSDREMQIQVLSEENKALREEIVNNSRVATALAKEEDGLEDESNKKATEITQQQLEAANSELRMLKVQSEQWRKAVEVATSMISNNNTAVGSSPPNYSAEDIEDESPKKKNMMMLKKIGGVLWKKGQNK